jgi:hypothetical protein
VTEACITLPLLGSGLDEAGMVRDVQLAGALRAVLRALESAGASGKSAAEPNFPLT